MSILAFFFQKNELHNDHASLSISQWENNQNEKKKEKKKRKEK
jgi:hypothetical protein